MTKCAIIKQSTLITSRRKGDESQLFEAALEAGINRSVKGRQLPYFYVNFGVIYGVGLHLGLQTGVTFLENWGYTFGFFAYKQLSEEKYRFFKIATRFWRFALKKKPRKNFVFLNNIGIIRDLPNHNNHYRGGNRAKGGILGDCQRNILYYTAINTVESGLLREPCGIFQTQGF